MADSPYRSTSEVGVGKRESALTRVATLIVCVVPYAVMFCVLLHWDVKWWPPAATAYLVGHVLTSLWLRDYYDGPRALRWIGGALWPGTAAAVLARLLKRGLRIAWMWIRYGDDESRP